MLAPEPYDLLVILAGDKYRRHPPAIDLMRLGWARHLAVTGTRETIEVTPDLAEKVIDAPPSTSTFGDALSVAALVRQHGFERVLVLTSSSQCDRARLALRRVLADDHATIDVMAWEPSVGTTSPLRTVGQAWRAHLSETCKIAYYWVRRRLG